MRHNVDFTKSGWRQFAKLNRFLGSRFLKGFILRSEVGAYIAAHAASGKALDTVCQELHYENGVYLLLKQMGDTWYITDIWAEDAPEGFIPVYLWTRIKHGCSHLLVQLLIGWQQKVCSFWERKVLS